MKPLSLILRCVLMLVGIVFVVVLTTLPGTSALVTTLSNLAGDTIGHAVLFGLLTLLVFWTLRGGVSRRKAAFIAFVFVLALGVITELVQANLFDRGASLTDLLADGIGALIVVGGVELYPILVQRKSRES